MDILNESQILEIYNKLYPYTQVDAQVKKLHIENVDNQRSYRETHIVQNRQKWQHDVKKADGNTCLKCPWCNGKLVQRTAKKGEHAGQTFYGCKNYPKCTYIQNIHDTKSV